MFSSGTNNKGICNMIRIRPNFHSLSFGHLPQPAHIKLMRQVVRASHHVVIENVEMTLAFTSRWRIINNRNNLYGLFSTKVIF